MKHIMIKAANLVTGKRYDKLLEICESQKTVSTRKVERLVYELMEGDRIHGIYLKQLVDNLKVVENKQLKEASDNALECVERMRIDKEKL